jgi:hypothetical protein
MLSKLMPLHDKDIKGADLVPALAECGEELARFFDLDTEALCQIVNDGVDEAKRKVDEEDLDLLVLSSMSGQYVVMKLSEIVERPVEPLKVSDALKDYLYEKYLKNELVFSNKKGFSLDRELMPEPHLAY